ncbi:MAG: hypothetical protein JNM07_06175 [Phycisphaerae bacterium]|nr:hypothetical protein [Phycisphaerae bacterium]
MSIFSRARRTGAVDKRTLVMIGIALAAFGFSGFLLARTVWPGAGDPAYDSKRRNLIDSETLQPFRDHPIKEGTIYPWPHPGTGKSTLYPAEACYWTADGRVKLEPTWVLLKTYLGESGDTTCPDCGRKVVRHNPMPPTEMFVELQKKMAG